MNFARAVIISSFLLYLNGTLTQFSHPLILVSWEVSETVLASFSYFLVIVIIPPFRDQNNSDWCNNEDKNRELLNPRGAPKSTGAPPSSDPLFRNDLYRIHSIVAWVRVFWPMPRCGLHGPWIWVPPWIQEFPNNLVKHRTTIFLSRNSNVVMTGCNVRGRLFGVLKTMTPLKRRSVITLFQSLFNIDTEATKQCRIATTYYMLLESVFNIWSPSCILVISWYWSYPVIHHSPSTIWFFIWPVAFQNSVITCKIRGVTLRLWSEFAVAWNRNTNHDVNQSTRVAQWLEFECIFSIQAIWVPERSTTNTAIPVLLLQHCYPCMEATSCGT